MEAKESTQAGKIGLALSGGGFRAAFFHIGVLARLAEIGILPKVEVISTVSGGSIVGALYYVCLKRRLEKAGGAGLEKDEYLELVAEVEWRLRAATQKGIRNRVFANPLKNLKMMFSPRYSRSDRIGDLYDRYLYKEAWGSPLAGKWRGRGPQKQIELRDLLGRGVILPSLLLNATSLNSGHNWRFEATGMGESLPEDEDRKSIVEKVDKNMWLKPGYFEPKGDQTPVPAVQADFPLALAVAASAAVPGVFEPLAVSKMYGDIRVQLADGGVQDNQGLQGLIDSDCKQLIVSDASGQMVDQNAPATRILGVLGRSASIEGDRVRDEQLLEMLGGDYERTALMHLRKGLDRLAIEPGESRPKARSERVRDGNSIVFGVHRKVQGALSQIRTDLDFFGDVEASALELDGYLMSEFELRENGFAAEGKARVGAGHKWVFGTKQLKTDLHDADPKTLAILEAGKVKFFRSLALHPAIGRATRIALVFTLVAAIAVGWHDIADLFDARWSAGIVLIALLLTALFIASITLDARSKLLQTVLRGAKLVLSLPFAPLVAIAAVPIFLGVTLSERAKRRL